MIGWILGQLFAFLASSSSATCPPSWSVATVRSTGIYTCELVRREGDPDRRPFARRLGHVYCSSGAIAYSPDARVIACLAVRS